MFEQLEDDLREPIEIEGVKGRLPGGGYPKGSFRGTVRLIDGQIFVRIDHESNPEFWIEFRLKGQTDNREIGKDDVASNQSWLPPHRTDQGGN